MKLHKVLLVDDDVSILNMIIDCFEETNANYLFYRANNGREALRIIADHLPDLIVTDWEMPIMNGVELIQYLKNCEQTRHIPVVMLTGKMTHPEYLEIAFGVGAIDFIRKPLEKIELIARVRSMLMLADSYKEAIDLKNLDLANTAKQIVQNNEFNVKLRHEIIKLQTSYGHLDQNLNETLSDFAHLMSEKIKSEAHNKFDIYFKQIHPDFFNRLITICPSISPAELRLAAFLKLNIGTKEIAAIMFLTIDSVRTARTRLRKKIGLKQDDNLITFLLSI
jgi:DNA-binding response OmpR family regulator/DNA-binding CsgD family transcriptional regulator